MFIFCFHSIYLFRQDSITRFPRIKKLSQYNSNNNDSSNNNSSNTEQFFSNNYKLFIYSLRFIFDINQDGNIDELDLLLTVQDASLFIKEFLPLSQLGLLKALGAVRLFIYLHTLYSYIYHIFILFIYILSSLPSLSSLLLSSSSKFSLSSL